MFELQRMKSFQRVASFRQNMMRKPSTSIRNILCDGTLSRTTKKYRDKMDRSLKSVGKTWSLKLRMNQRGICSFQCAPFLVLIEIPKDSSSFFIHTCLMKCAPYSTVVMRKALELNFLQTETRGCTVALKPSCGDGKELDMSLCYSRPIESLGRDDLRTTLLNFIDTAVSIRKTLQNAEQKASGIRIPSLQQRRSIVRRPRPKLVAPPPPPPQLDNDLTPIFSNKTVDKKIFGDKKHHRRQSIRKESQPTKEFTKANMTLGIAISTLPETKDQTPTESKQSKIISRLNRIASKTSSRPELPRRNAPQEIRLSL